CNFPFMPQAREQVCDVSDIGQLSSQIHESTGCAFHIRAAKVELDKQQTEGTNQVSPTQFRTSHFPFLFPALTISSTSRPSTVVFQNFLTRLYHHKHRQRWRPLSTSSATPA